MVAAGGTYTVCHGSFAGDLTLCDETRTLYHNGNDAQGLIHTPSSTLLDVVGDIATSNTYWDVAGVSQGTKDHTLVRKSTVTSGNTDWAASAGTNADDSEWVVLPQNTWDYMGSHPHTFTYDCAGVANGTAIEDECGVCDGPGLNADGCCGDSVPDCLGNCGGTAVVDICGVCDGGLPDSYVCDGSSEYGNAFWGADCANGADEGEHCCDAGLYDADTCAALYDCAGVFMGDSVVDCAGVCGGSAMYDACLLYTSPSPRD